MRTKNGFWKHKFICKKFEPNFNRSFYSHPTTSLGNSANKSIEKLKKLKTGKRRISIGLTGPQVVDTTSVDTSLDLHQQETSNNAVFQMEVDTGKAGSSSIAETQRIVTNMRQQTQTAQKEKEKSKKEQSEASEAEYSKYVKEFVRLMRKVDASYQTQIDKQRSLNEAYLRVLKKIEDKVDKIL